MNVEITPINIVSLNNAHTKEHNDGASINLPLWHNLFPFMFTWSADFLLLLKDE